MRHRATVTDAKTQVLTSARAAHISAEFAGLERTLAGQRSQRQFLPGRRGAAGHTVGVVAGAVRVKRNTSVRPTGVAGGSLQGEGRTPTSLPWRSLQRHSTKTKLNVFIVVMATGENDKVQTRVKAEICWLIFLFVPAVCGTIPRTILSLCCVRPCPQGTATRRSSAPDHGSTSGWQQVQGVSQTL